MRKQIKVMHVTLASVLLYWFHLLLIVVHTETLSLSLHSLGSFPVFAHLSECPSNLWSPVWAGDKCMLQDYKCIPDPPLSLWYNVRLKSTWKFSIRSTVQTGNQEVDLSPRLFSSHEHRLVMHTWVRQKVWSWMVQAYFLIRNNRNCKKVNSMFYLLLKIVCRTL